MNFFKNLKTRNLILFLGFLAIASACATRPMKVSKRGLLDRSPQSSADEGDDELRAARRYDLREGEKINLPGEWRWPLNEVKISSPYGDRGRKFHQGVDFHAPMNTPVYAASSGEVVYVGSKIRGYGRMIVIKHAGNYYTVYAHHSKNLVRLGNRVKIGQLIAYSGKSGRSTGPHLHFELRRGTQSYDPELAIRDSIRRDIASAKSKQNDTL